jgi:hypothetical protein
VNPGNRTAQFDRDGFAVVPDVLDHVRCDELLVSLQRRDEETRLRRLLDLPLVSELASALMLRDEIASLAPPDARAVQCTFFDKSAERNWSVGPHQDLSLPLPGGARTLPEGWRNSSNKDGIEFGQPPASILERVLAVRVQLDAVENDEGALEVLPGTHRRGRLDAVDLAGLALVAERMACPVPRAGALLMRPLLVHGSRRLHAGNRRRVLHFVFAPRESS